jgi:hypothetical protein
MRVGSIGIGSVLGGGQFLTGLRQDKTPRAEVWRLASDIAWLGVAYGAKTTASVPQLDHAGHP